MKDPLLPLNLEQTTALSIHRGPCKLASVKKLLLKGESADAEIFSDIENQVNHLAQTESQLRNLTDQMGKFQRAFQAMQTWQIHLSTSYIDLVQQRCSVEVSSKS